MLASTNINTHTSTHTFKHNTHTHTHTQTGPRAWTLIVQYLPMSRASERGSFYEHKHHSNDLKKAPVQLPVKNHFGASQIKKRPVTPLPLEDLSRLDSERFEEDF